MVDTRSKPTRQPKRQVAASPSPSKRPKAASRTPSSASRKNKVVATKPIKSPELKLPGILDSQTLEDSSVLSIASSTASRPGLSFHIQKQLAKDIESNGGIGVFRKQKVSQAVCKFLDKQDNPIYGVRGDPLRSQLQQYIKRWKRLDREGTYAEKVLNRFTVQSAANQRAAERNKTAKQSKESSSFSSGDDSGSDSSSSISTKGEEEKPKPTKRKLNTADPVLKVASKPLKSISFKPEEKEEVIMPSPPPKIPHSLETGTLRSLHQACHLFCVEEASHLTLSFHPLSPRRRYPGEP